MTGRVERGFKYEGLGNDFLVLDRLSSGTDLSPAAARALCDRRRGVGADGVLVLLPSSRAAVRLPMPQTAVTGRSPITSNHRERVRRAMPPGLAKPVAVFNVGAPV